MSPHRLTFGGGRIGEIAEGPLSKLSPILEFQEFADGAVVLREGDDGDWLGVVLDGEGIVEKRIEGTADGVEIVALISRGDMIGEMAFVDRKPRSATIRARGRMQLARLQRAAFRAAMSEDPESAEILVGTLLSTMSARLRDSTEAIVALYQAGRELGTTRSLQEVCDGLLQHMAKSVPAAKQGIVAVFDRGEAKAVVNFGFVDAPRSPLPIAQDDVLLRALLATPTGVVISTDHQYASSLAFLGLKWCLVTEIALDGNLLGFAVLGSQNERMPFRPNHGVVMAMLADQAAPAVQRYVSELDLPR
ncbi:MAG TPA: cyclic nucleotide-binding domain-containing protein [Gemmatimonadaceae bacterium]